MDTPPPSTNPFDPYNLPVEYRRVGFGPRFVAWLLDAIGVWILSVVLVFLFVAAGIPESAFVQEAVQQMVDSLKMAQLSSDTIDGIYPYLQAMFYTGIIAPLLYWCIEAFTGASPGKRVMKLRIMMEDESPADPSIVALRTVIKSSEYILKLVTLFPIPLMVARVITSTASTVQLALFIGCFFVLSTRKQALHDRIARTAIFRSSNL